MAIAPTVAAVGALGYGSVPVPSGVVSGSLVLVFVESVWNDGSAHSASDTTVSGFTYYAGSTSGLVYGTYSITLGCWYKYATGVDSGTYTVTGPDVSTNGVATTIAGAPTSGVPFSDSAQSAYAPPSTSSVTLGSWTPGADDSLILGFGWGAGATSFTSPAGWTDLVNSANTDSDANFLSSFTQSTVTATGGLTWTGAGSTDTLEVFAITLRAIASDGGDEDGFTSASTAPATIAAPPGKYIAGTSGRHFIDQDGDPILMKGQAGVFLLQDTGIDNACAALDVCASTGANLVWVDLLQQAPQWNNEPLNAYGTDDGVYAFKMSGNTPDFTQPNEAYWTRVDQFIAHAASLDIIVGCDPHYGGIVSTFYNAGSTAWSAYATFLAQRYGAVVNVLWVIGEDWNPSEWSTYGPMWQSFYNTFRTLSTSQLWTVEGYGRGTTDVDLSSGITGVTGIAQIEWGYTYQASYKILTASRARASTMPVVMGDGYSETVPTAGASWTLLGARSQAGWAYSSGVAGETYIWEDIWYGMEADYTTLTASTGVTQVGYMRTAMEAIDWWTLLPATGFLTFGAGTDPTSGTNGDGGVGPSDTTFATAAVSSDGTLAVIYTPTSRALGIDLTQLASSPTGYLVDPTTGATQPLTVAASLAAPGMNKSGASDWLYVIHANVAPDATRMIYSGTAWAVPSGRKRWDGSTWQDATFDS